MLFRYNSPFDEHVIACAEINDIPCNISEDAIQTLLSLMVSSQLAGKSLDRRIDYINSIFLNTTITDQDQQQKLNIIDSAAFVFRTLCWISLFTILFGACALKLSILVPFAPAIIFTPLALMLISGAAFLICKIWKERVRNKINTKLDDDNKTLVAIPFAEFVQQIHGTTTRPYQELDYTLSRCGHTFPRPLLRSLVFQGTTTNNICPAKDCGRIIGIQQITDLHMN